MSEPAAFVLLALTFAAFGFGFCLGVALCVGLSTRADRAEQRELGERD